MDVFANHHWLSLRFASNRRGANHIDVLKKAREQMVKIRRDAADVLSQPFDRSKTPNSLTTFLEAQDAIEQIDKAIEDEQKQEPSP